MNPIKMTSAKVSDGETSRRNIIDGHRCTLSTDVRILLFVAIHEAGVDVVRSLREQTCLCHSDRENRGPITSELNSSNPDNIIEPCWMNAK